MGANDSGRRLERLKAEPDPLGLLFNLFVHAPVGLAIWRPDGTTVLTNAAFLQLFGSEPPPEHNVLRDGILAAKGLKHLFERAFAGETVTGPTMWLDPREVKSIEVKDGKRVAVSITVFPLLAATGEVAYVAATYTDETRLTLEAERLLLTKERQRLAQEAARVGTFELDVQTGVNAWTPELEAMHGLAPGELNRRGIRWEQLVHADDRANAKALVEEALTTFLPVEGEWRVVWPDGTVHWLFARFKALRDLTGAAHRLIGANLDITDRKLRDERAAEAELLRRENEAAQAANRELEAFSYSVAHDLRSPLRGISGFSGLLLEDHADSLDEEGKGLLRRVMSSAERMSQLIDTLLSLARVSRTTLRREVVNLTQMAESVVEQLRAREPQRSVELVTRRGIMANGDPSLLRVVLENLLGNAWKFTKNVEHPRIELGCEVTAEGTRYYVRDNGAGFDMTFAHRLFNPFQRLHSSDQFEGTGVGLATVQRIIVRHGGRVWVEAKENVGANFQFELPEKETTKEHPWTPAK